jgi:hypothetical protein
MLAVAVVWRVGKILQIPLQYKALAELAEEEELRGMLLILHLGL